MAVQQNRKSPSKRGMHRSHDGLSNPPLALEPTTGEVHLRHHISPTGYYRGKKVIKTKSDYPGIPPRHRPAAEERIQMDVTVAVDCMGGDHGVHVTVPAALACLQRDPDAACVLVGQRVAIERELARLGAAPGLRLRIQHATEIVGM